jgi:hypothetical protein
MAPTKSRKEHPQATLLPRPTPPEASHTPKDTAEMMSPYRPKSDANQHEARKLRAEVEATMIDKKKLKYAIRDWEKETASIVEEAKKVTASVVSPMARNDVWQRHLRRQLSKSKDASLSGIVFC